MAPPSDDRINDRILAELLKLTAGVTEIGGKVDRLDGELNAKVDRLDSHLAEQGQSLLVLRDSQARIDHQVAELVARAEGVEERLVTTEHEVRLHGRWRTRLRGIWIGAVAVIGLAGGLAALVWKILGK